MTVTISLFGRLLQKKISAREICEVLKEHYANEFFVEVADFLGEGILQDNFIAANSLAGTNRMQIFVCGNDERITVTSRFDNLGKGASGAAIQCMNIMMGADEKISLA
jgi:N-acetyl-gamma-glutamyl-phosphate reductase